MKVTESLVQEAAAFIEQQNLEEVISAIPGCGCGGCGLGCSGTVGMD